MTAEFRLQRRIPPFTERELYFQFRSIGMIEQDAACMAHDMYAANMEDIYRLARLGETAQQGATPSDFPEQHRQGRLSIENDEIVREMDLTDCDVGIQVSHDGRIWLCVNGTAWIRFKPSREH